MSSPGSSDPGRVPVSRPMSLLSTDPKLIAPEPNFCLMLSIARSTFSPFSMLMFSSENSESCCAWFSSQRFIAVIVSIRIGSRIDQDFLIIDSAVSVMTSVRFVGLSSCCCLDMTFSAGSLISTLTPKAFSLCLRRRLATVSGESYRSDLYIVKTLEIPAERSAIAYGFYFFEMVVSQDRSSVEPVGIVVYQVRPVCRAFFLSYCGLSSQAPRSF